MGNLGDFLNFAFGWTKRKTPAEYKEWQEVTMRTIEELKNENLKLKEIIKEQQQEIRSLKVSKNRGMYE